MPDNEAADIVALHEYMSMPNVLCTEPGLGGYIDLARMKLGTPDIDLADAIWSLQCNLGHSYGELLLREYGDVAVTERLQKTLDFSYAAKG